MNISNLDIDGESAKFQTLREKFLGAQDFHSALDVVWGKDFLPHRFYQHYTTLSRLLGKLSGRWWFARSDSGEFNDRQESKKFGNPKLAARTYQTSFVHGAAESVALWSLYAPSDPFAIRITIPGEALKAWVVSRKGDFLRFEDSPRRRKIVCSELKDLVYAAVDFRDKRKGSRDIARCNNLYWSEVNCSAKLQDLENQIKEDVCTGWMKDYEWRHERESRICLRVEKGDGPKGLWCAVTPELIECMKFTFSPWLPMEFEDDVKSIIVNALKTTESKRGPKAMRYAERFRRSVVQGAISLRRSKLLCVFEDGAEAGQCCPLCKMVSQKEVKV